MDYPITLKEKGGICIFKIIKYGLMTEPYNDCVCCGKPIPSYSFGLLTIVSEGFWWCYKCAVSRLEYEPELQDFLKSLLKENSENGC